MEHIPLKIYNRFEFRVFSFSWKDGHKKSKDPSLLYYLNITRRRIVWFIPFQRILALCEIQTTLSRIWTQGIVSISYEDYHYTTSASNITGMYITYIKCLMFLYTSASNIAGMYITYIKCVTRCWAFAVWVWVSTSHRILLFVLVRNPLKGLAREISHETGRRRGKEGPRAEQRRRQSRGGRTEKWTEQGNRLERAVNKSQGKLTARMCGPRDRVDQRERMSPHSWWLCGNFVRTHAPDSSLNAKKVSQTSHFFAWS